MSHLNRIEEFARIVDSLTNEDPLTNRRSDQRRSRSISLQVQPLDLDFHNDGLPFWTISRDISRRGLAFINSEPVDPDYLRIGLLEHEITIIGQVRHSTSIGDHYPLFLVGVEFVFED